MLLASEPERQMEDAGSYDQLGFEDRLTLLVDSEWNRRQNNKLKALINKAKLSDSSATIEGIEYIEDRHLDKGRMAALYNLPVCRRGSSYYSERSIRHGKDLHCLCARERCLPQV